MRKLMNKALRPLKHSSVYIMLMVSIAVFLVFIGLITNPQIIEAMNAVEYTLSIWMYALICILAIFSFIYYYYVCAYIFDEKIKDYGILVSLGQSLKSIKNAFMEALARSLMGSLLGGILSGTLFYCIILILLSKTMNKTFRGLPYTGYIILVAAYLVIYLINVCVFSKRMKNMGISEMMNYKKQDKSIKHPKLYQFMGLTLLVCGILLLLFNYGTSYSFASAIMPMLCLTMGAYFLTHTFPFWFVKLFAGSRSRYLNNLFFISQLRTNYTKYAKLLVACTITIIFGLYMMIIDFNFAIEDSNNDFEKPYDFAVHIDNVDANTRDQIEAFEINCSQIIKAVYLTEIQDGTIAWDSDKYTKPIHIMPERSYGQLTGNNMKVKNGEIVVLSQLNREYYNLGVQTDDGIEWGFSPPGSVTFKVKDNIYQGNIVKEIWENVYNIEDQYQRTYIISNTDYDTIINSQERRQYEYFVNAKDESSLSEVYSELKKVNPDIEAKLLSLENKAQDKLIVSIMILLAAMLLLFSLISLIRLRIQQNIKEERVKYNNLFLVGYTNEQLQREIRKEMIVLFFLPLIIGSIISLLYTVFSDAKSDISFVVTALTITLLFFIVEYIFYRLTIMVLSKQYLRND